MRNLSKNVEILPSKRFESHSQSANGLKRSFGVKNDKYGPCHGADFYINDALSRSQNPEDDTQFSGTSPYRKIYEYSPPPPGDLGHIELQLYQFNRKSITILAEFQACN